MLHSCPGIFGRIQQRLSRWLTTLPQCCWFRTVAKLTPKRSRNTYLIGPRIYLSRIFDKMSLQLWMRYISKWICFHIQLKPIAQGLAFKWPEGKRAKHWGPYIWWLVSYLPIVAELSRRKSNWFPKVNRLSVVDRVAALLAIILHLTHASTVEGFIIEPPRTTPHIGGASMKPPPLLLERHTFF